MPRPNASGSTTHAHSHSTSRRRPAGASRRVQTFEEITATEPHKPLTEPLQKSGGRNNTGELTSWWRGGGHKRAYRIIDFKRDKLDIPAKVATIEYDPNRSARIALVTYADGEKRYILQPAGLKVGDTVIVRRQRRHPAGQRLPLKNIPLGTHGAQRRAEARARAARWRAAPAAAVQLVAKEGDYVTVRMPSSEVRLVNVECYATIGQVGNLDHENVSIGKAGRSRWLGRRPHVRGVAMNPVDHPLGGGEGKTSGGRHPVTPWGVPTKGYKTRNSKSHGHVHRDAADRSRNYEPITEEGPVRRHAAPREGRGDEPRERQEGHQDLVAPLDGRFPRWSATRWPCTTGGSSSRSTSPRTWSATSSASSRRRGTFKGHTTKADKAATRRAPAGAPAAAARSSARQGG